MIGPERELGPTKQILEGLLEILWSVVEVMLDVICW